jgi:nucleoside-diphosphate-sugar epimerase
VLTTCDAKRLATMRIFLTGATGYIGSGILDALLRAGHRVTALVRDERKARRLQKLGAATVVGDLKGRTWAASAEGHDGFVHTAIERPPHTADADQAGLETLLGAARNSGRNLPFVFTSSVWVIGSTGQPADERVQTHPPRYSAWREGHEAHVLGADGVRPIVVRPGVVYGGSRGLIGDLFRDAINGLIRVVGNGKNHWACVYERDLADLYLRLVTAPDASGVYHATDDTEETVLDIVEALGRNTTHKPDVRFVPLEEARAKMGPYADALALDQIVRSPRARALGWVPSLKSVSGNIPRLLEEWRAGNAAETA